MMMIITIIAVMIFIVFSVTINYRVPGSIPIWEYFLWK